MSLKESQEYVKNNTDDTMIGDVFHVLPINDIFDHTHDDTMKCNCKPKIVHEYGVYTVIHNAWDNRELFEELSTEVAN